MKNSCGVGCCDICGRDGQLKPVKVKGQAERILACEICRKDRRTAVYRKWTSRKRTYGG